MSITTVYPSTSQPTGKYEWSPQQSTWQGFVDTNPILRALIAKQADAQTTSWDVYGSNARTAREWLLGVTGNGKQTFTMLQNIGAKMGSVGGDELYYIDLKNKNLQLLDPQNITFKIENGKIVKYKERTGNTSGFTPDQILHIPNSPDWSRPYGKSDIEPCKNLLLDWIQVTDDQAKIFHSYTRPTEVWHLKTNFPADIQAFKNQLAEVRKTPEAKLVIPNDLVDRVERISIPQGSVLDPSLFEKQLIQRLFQSFSTPELALGAGNANSEESYRMLHSGFGLTVRFKQNWREQCINQQLLKKLYPEKTPRIEFSFANEPEEERFERYRKFFNDVQTSSLTPEAKGIITNKLITQMKVLR